LLFVETVRLGGCFGSGADSGPACDGSPGEICSTKKPAVTATKLAR